MLDEYRVTPDACQREKIEAKFDVIEFDSSDAGPTATP